MGVVLKQIITFKKEGGNVAGLKSSPQLLPYLGQVCGWPAEYPEAECPRASLELCCAAWPGTRSQERWRCSLIVIVSMADCTPLCLPTSFLSSLLLEGQAGFSVVSKTLISGLSHLVMERIGLCPCQVRILMRERIISMLYDFPWSLKLCLALVGCQQILVG